eukprot:TRINITY_DN32437_c0_g1_i1.p1 TRINITY_DN32437_c0_g1~~TRINITY_DN32437_c0_g1_i1.p1  ORF type:complete len:193 (+),score=30.50 TRINITY_DN32437_c0_g1_i1:106-684(+)
MENTRRRTGPPDVSKTPWNEMMNIQQAMFKEIKAMERSGILKPIGLPSDLQLHPPPPPASLFPGLEKGKKALITGMHRRPDLNDVRCEVLDPNPDSKGFLLVRLLPGKGLAADAPEGRRKMLVKPANLQLPTLSRPLSSSGACSLPDLHRRGKAPLVPKGFDINCTGTWQVGVAGKRICGFAGYGIERGTYH